jgi:hypothetical protein
MARIGPDLDLSRPPSSGLVLRSDALDVGANLELLCKRAGERLVKQYPGWGWTINPDFHGLMLNITSHKLNPQYGYALRILDIHNDPTDNWATRAGAELLHRYGFTPGPFLHQEMKWRAAPRGQDGFLIPDVSDFEDRQVKRQIEISRRIATGDIAVVQMADGNQYLGVRK